MPTPPTSTKASLRQRLIGHARANWPQLADLNMRHRAGFAYIDGVLADGTTLPLCRLRYGGSANSWGFAIYLASRDGYEDSVLPTRYPVGTPEEALDCACGLYLNDPRSGFAFRQVSWPHLSSRMLAPAEGVRRVGRRRRCCAAGR
jgi:hypothetical protein